MKDLFLYTHQYPDIGVVEFIEDEIPYLSDRFDRVFVITTKDQYFEARDMPANVRWYSISNGNTLKGLIFLIPRIHILGEIGKSLRGGWRSLKKSIHFLLTASKLVDLSRKLQKEYHCNPAEVCHYSYWLAEVSLACACQSQRSKKVSRAHRFDLYDYATIFNHHPFRYDVIRRIDYIFPCSEDGSKYLSSQYPRFEHKIRTRYLGSRSVKMKSVPSQNLFTIVSCSSITDVKNVDRIVRVITALNRDDLMWIHIGDGPRKNSILRMIEQFNSQMVLKGALSNDDVHRFYQDNHVDLFINLSKSEGLPVSMMEAASYGIPIIARNVGGIREIVDDDTGLLLDADFCDKQIAYELGKLINDRDRINRMRVNIRKKWESSYNQENNYVSFSEEIQGLI